MPTNNRNDGKDLERTVGRVLSLTGWRIDREHILGHKKVDLCAKKILFGKQQTTVVECKDYAKPLDAEQTKDVYIDYEPLIETGLAQDVLLVTRAGISPSASTYVATKRHYFHRTLDELLREAIDFAPYLTSLVRHYESSGMAEYFVEMSTTDGHQIVKEIQSWLTDDSQQPLAVLASYGMGKTTLATHLAASAADQYLKTGAGRIPILVKLYDIAREQSLEGLLGKLFTAHNATPGFTFEGFMELNEAGRLFVILDGFDEMKFMISREEFKFNFSEFNRLVAGRAKVAILGRPSAFVSEDEYQELIRGRRSVLETAYFADGSPKYRELSLAPFSGHQVRDFLDRYVRFKMRTETEFSERERRLTTDRIANLTNKQLADIARRPVQLRMLADVLPRLRGSLKGITLTLLYAEFIEFIIEREVSKLTRRSIGVGPRRTFARNLAWHMWVAGGARSIRIADIPPELVNGSIPRDVPDFEAAKRDLVAACFLEATSTGHVFFPHRSFQEYLVAEELLQRLGKGLATLVELDRIANEEIVHFLADMAGAEQLQSLRKRLLGVTDGLSGRTIGLLFQGFSIEQLIRACESNSSAWSEWEVIAITKELRRPKVQLSKAFLRTVIAFLDRLRLSTNKVHKLALVQYATVALLQNSPKSGHSAFQTAAYLWSIADLLGWAFDRPTRGFTRLSECVEDLSRAIGALPKVEIDKKVGENAPLLRYVAAHEDPSEKHTLNLRPTYVPLRQLLAEGPHLSEWVAATGIGSGEIDTIDTSGLRGDWAALSRAIGIVRSRL